MIPVDTPSSAEPPTPFGDREQLLDFLLEAAAITSETLDLDILLPRVAEVVQRVLPVSLFAIMLYDEKADGLRIRYAIGHRPEVIRTLIVPMGEGITGAAAQSRRPEVVSDVREDRRYIAALDVVQSEAAIPMVAVGQLIGVIDIQSPVANAFLDSDIALLELLATRVAVAIRNAELHQAVEKQNRTLATMASLGAKFSSILALDELIEQIAAELHRLFAYDAFTVYLVDQERRILRSQFTLRYGQQVQLENLPLDQGVTGAAVQSKSTVRVANVLADSRYVPLLPDIRSEVAAPLIRNNEVIGVVNLESEKVAFFSEADEALLTLLATPMAIAIENARLYEDIARREQELQFDLQAAWDLQKIMVPTIPPRISGLEIALGFRPARRISGDLYQFYDTGDGQWLIAFGDVSGKGVAAALYGALVNGLLSTLAPRRYSPGSLLKATNQMLMRRQIGTRYIALMMLSWNPERRDFLIANAGSTPVLVLREGECIEPEIQGIPLGMVKGAQYEENSLHAKPGDLLVLYSDGIPDQMNPEGEQYSAERLKALLRRKANLAPKPLVGEIYRDVARFAGSAPPTDDQTLVVLRVQ